jgi:capsular exopolysaccharide synthesis family protein
MARFLLERRARREEARSNDLSQRLVTIVDPANAASEVYRTLRTRLYNTLLAEGQRPKVILVTSSGSKEGKSTTCANLGVVMAQAGKNVLILDCDLRQPVMHRLFGLGNLHGVMSVLAEERSLREVWEEPVEGLKVVPVGAIPPNPAEILGTRRFSEFLAHCREEFDYVLVDTSPVGVASDPVILAPQGDGVLLVLDAQSTLKETLRQSVRSLEAVGANILGTVVNNVKI